MRTYAVCLLARLDTGADTTQHIVGKGSSASGSSLVGPALRGHLPSRAPKQWRRLRMEVRDIYSVHVHMNLCCWSCALSCADLTSITIHLTDADENVARQFREFEDLKIVQLGGVCAHRKLSLHVC